MTAARSRAVPTATADAPGFAFAPVTIADEDFEAFRRLIHAHTGIALAPCKRYLVQARLAKRLRELHVELPVWHTVSYRENAGRYGFAERPEESEHITLAVGYGYGIDAPRHRGFGGYEIDTQFEFEY